MSITELIPVLQTLSRSDKLRLVQLLVRELVEEEGLTPLTGGNDYALWTPYNAYEASATLLKALDETKAT